MLKTETVTVDLPVELLAQVRGAVEDGDYPSSNEAISDALQGWSERRGVVSEDAEWLREAWDEAEKDDRPSVPMDEVFDRLKSKYRAMSASTGK